MESIAFYEQNDLRFIEQSLKSILTNADLDWEIISRPSLYLGLDNKIKTSQKQLLFKKQNNELHELVSTGKDFSPVNPSHLVNAFLLIKEHINLELISAGHTREGKHIYLLASLKGPVEMLGLTLERCLFFSTSNDGNAKTKITPVTLNEKLSIQLSQSMAPKQTDESYVLSHHYDFDPLEAAIKLKDLLCGWDAYFDELKDLAEYEANKSSIAEFNHQIYQRFNIGNASTKRKYELVMQELESNYEQVNQNLPKDIKDTMLAIYMAFNHYIDQTKSRRGELSGKIHSINFGVDGLTKKTSFYLCKKIAAAQIKNLLTKK